MAAKEVTELPSTHGESYVEMKEESSLSKNQLKKLKKKEKWLAIKQDKRRNAKLKRKMRLAEMRESGEDTGPTRKSLKRKTMTNSTCKIKVVIDLSLDEYMAEKDVNSLTSQLQHSYAANRRADNPMQLYFCGISGKTKERLDKIGDYKGWDIYPEARSYDQAFPKESLVYLSSESDNVLTTLSEDKVYIIGGLVDHNKHKGLCHRLAEEKGIAHAQLPIGEYLDMKTRKVLTVNQVFSILLRYTETKDWKEAFLMEMPQRKQAFVKQKGDMESLGSHPSSNRDAQITPSSETQEGQRLQKTEADDFHDQGINQVSQVNTEKRDACIEELKPYLEEKEQVSKNEASEKNNGDQTSSGKESGGTMDTNLSADTEESKPCKEEKELVLKNEAPEKIKGDEASSEQGSDGITGTSLDFETTPNNR